MNDANNYIDDFGLYHDKPVGDNGKSSSNNPWIYSAYASLLGLPLSLTQIKYTFDRCMDSKSLFQMDRLPDKTEPPQSRDEIIGMVSLGFLDYKHFEKSNWLWLKNVDLFEAIPLHKQLKAVWKIRNEHRNFIWDSYPPIYDAYPIAFRLWWHDRYYMKVMGEKTPTSFEYFMFKLYEYSTRIKGTDGEKNLLYLQLIDMRMLESANRINIGKTMRGYFGDEHIFIKGTFI